MEITIDGEDIINLAKVPDQCSAQAWSDYIEELANNLPKILLANPSEVEYSGVAILRDRLEHHRSSAMKPDKIADNPEEARTHFLLRTNPGKPLPITDSSLPKSIALATEVPNYRNKKGQRADMVALTEDGGLGVFEFKDSSNTSTYPCKALVQAVGYAACLAHKSNWEQIRKNIEENIHRVIREGLSDAGFQLADSPKISYIALCAPRREEDKRGFLEHECWDTASEHCLDIIAALPGDPKFELLEFNYNMTPVSV